MTAYRDRLNAGHYAHKQEQAAPTKRRSTTKTETQDPKPDPPKPDNDDDGA